MTATNAIGGIQQIALNYSVESLLRIGDDGRAQPLLAKEWAVSPDGLSLIVKLRPGVKFHDGSPVTAAVVAKVLEATLPRRMGPAFDDVLGITAATESEITIRLRQPSPFVLESLEAPIQKPGTSGVGTGPFKLAGPAPSSELTANDDYYLGRPAVKRIIFEAFPSVRAAWAEMLRGRIDMLYEVGADALDSMQGASNVSVFPYTRRYQFAIIFNPRSDALRSSKIRQALNEAIDRAAVVREALNGHGTESFGLVWLHHWAFQRDPRFPYDPARAAAALTRPAQGTDKKTSAAKLRFTCLVPPDYERIGLEVKRQLEAVGVNMELQEETTDLEFQAYSSGNFEAALLDPVSAPSLFRVYQWWHTKAFFNQGSSVGSAALDSALDRIQHAGSDSEYRAAVTQLQEHILVDPPAIFLAWGERARAVSRRFEVPSEPGRDVLSMLYLWRPVNAERKASQN